MNRVRPIGALLAVTLLAATACEEGPTEPTEYRTLGVVTSYSGGLEANPRAWIVRDRHIRIEISTEGVCHVVRPDWDVMITDGHIETPGFVFILPYEVRATSCRGSHSATREGSPRILFADTLDVFFQTALEATVRVVSGDGQVYDRLLDFHPGWPPEES